MPLDNINVLAIHNLEREESSSYQCLNIFTALLNPINFPGDTITHKEPVLLTCDFFLWQC